MVDDIQKHQTIFPDARENYIYETHNFNSPTNVINRELQRSNDLQRAYEGHTVPQRFPDWVPHDLINPDQSFTDLPVGGKSWMGSPMWMDAGITNRNLGGYKVMNAEEQGGGIFNYPFTDNPLMNDLFKRNRERRMEELKRRQLEDWNAEKDWGLNNWDTTRDERYSETIQKLVLDRIINPQNYNSEPGTGDLYPLIADPYWNI